MLAQGLQSGNKNSQQTLKGNNRSGIGIWHFTQSDHIGLLGSLLCWAVHNAFITINPMATDFVCNYFLVKAIMCIFV